MGVGKAIKWILLLPLILAGLGIAYCEANKAYWDHRVRELCKKDGGVTVFERIDLLPNALGKSSGNRHEAIDVQFEDHALPADIYARRFDTQVLYGGYPEIRRYEESIVRRADKKTMVRKISYARVGGDFPNGIIHPSSFSCAEVAEFDEKSIPSEITSRKMKNEHTRGTF